MSNGNRNKWQGGGRRQNGGHQAQSRDQRDELESVDEIWSNYLKDGYFNERGFPRTEFMDREHVMPLVEALGSRDRNPPLTNSQIRRFFNHARGIETRLRNGSDWGEIAHAFHQLDLAAADAAGKSDKKIPLLFHDFIRANVMAVTRDPDPARAFIKGFMPHFEAVIGFGSGKFTEGKRS
ncbi:MAG: hypothetical protein GMKNLPBB_01016 [Myxococcota bacterium]|nr:hypothetical protein [Myxococcota bacterium]